MRSGSIAGVEDAFGVRARALRRLEARLRSLAEEAGCEEVIPPLVERAEVLQRGADRRLLRQTIVFSDPEGGGALAIRPDATPQLARLVASRLLAQLPLRLFYSLPVLQAHPDGPGGRREAWQFGIELFGLAEEQGDEEALRLAARVLASGRLHAPVLLVGHLALLRALVEDRAVEDWIDVLARRSPDDISALAAREGLNEARARLLLSLCFADESWLAAQAANPTLPEAFRDTATRLLALAEGLRKRESGIEVRVEPALVPRFGYHDGIVFDGFAQEGAQALLHGGRYDGLLCAHGQKISAVGFSLDLWDWLDATQEE